MNKKKPFLEKVYPGFGSSVLVKKHTEFLKTNNEGYFEFFFKKGTKYLIDSVVIIEGSNKKKDNYAKWHSLWASYTLQTPDL